MIDELNLNSANGTHQSGLELKSNMNDTEDADIIIPTTKEMIKSNLNKNKFSKRDKDDSKY